MSVICQNFVQNTWRKDLCSNCFKSEADHSSSGCKNSVDRGRYVPQATSVYQARVISPGIHWRPLLPDSISRIHDSTNYEKIACRDIGLQTAVKDNTIHQNGVKNMTSSNNSKSILKQQLSSSRKQSRRTSVGFTSEEPLVIGYGGNDYDSDEGTWELGSDDGSINLELLDSTDEDRCITKLTKNNTEFNSVNDNLMSSPNLRQNPINSTKTYHYATPNLSQPSNNQVKNNTISNKTSENDQDKKLSFYYFSTKEEPPKPIIQNQNHVEHMNFLNECSEMSIITKDIPGILNNIKNNQYEDSKVSSLNKINNLTSLNENLQQNTCHETSSSKYLLITKISDHSEASSDSDYSTSKQTNGESSTDTDSFHDAEDTTIQPRSSFLHGTSVQNSRHSEKESRIYIPDKPFETSSVSSGDTSTLSDDSDSQNMNVRKNNRTRSCSNKIIKCSPPSSNFNQEPVVNNKNKVNVSICHMDSHSNNYFISEHKSPANVKSLQSNINNFESEPNSKHDNKAFLHKVDNKTAGSQKSDYLSTSRPSEMDKNISIICTNRETNCKFQENTKTAQYIQSQENNEYTRQVQKTTDRSTELSKPHVQSENKNLASNESRKFMENKTIKSSPPNKTTTKSTNSSSPVKCTDHTPTARQSSVSKAKIIHETPSNVKITSIENDHGQKVSNENYVDYANVESNAVQHTNYSMITIPAVDGINDTVDKDQSSSNQSSARSSPSSKTSRETKLAALALELERARYDSKNKETKISHPPPPPPEIPKYNTPKSKVAPKLVKQSKSVESTKPAVDPTPKYPSIRRGRSIASSTNISKLASLPDLLPETTSSKLKKGRFSLKKLLKRGKDSETLVINNPPEHQQKAWKRQTFDRSRLSLEIVHPMDMTSDSQASNDSTPTDDKNHRHIFMDPSGRKTKMTCHNASSLRARSLSALPQLTSCVFDTSDAMVPNGLHRDLTIGDASASLDRTRMDMPRKAGTVAERSKKYKAPRRTPSFSELRTPTPSSGQTTTNDGNSVERPVRPPPPPRGKSLPPPLPTTAPPPCQVKVQTKNPTPNRPPPPKVLDGKEPGLTTPSVKNNQDGVNGDYANLGDIRLHITPKKPGRPSAISFARDSFEMDAQDITKNPTTELNPLQEEDDTYESVEHPEEEDHYTYLDDSEGKGEKQRNLNQDHKNKIYKTNSSNSTNTEDKTAVNLKDENYIKSSQPNVAMKKPWLDLQASYSAIAAANYESLAEFITTAINEGLEKLRKTTSSLKWNDFKLETEEPIQTLEDKFIYNAAYKSQPNIKVTLILTQTQHHTSQSTRNTTRPPVLANFSDSLLKKYVSTCNKTYNFTDSTKVMVYVLERSSPTTVDQFAENCSSYKTNQHIHLRNACFVLLQLIHTLKSLQADGIEEIDYDLRRLLLLHTDEDKPPILVLLPGDKAHLTMSDFYKADVATRKTTLCQTTLQLLLRLLHIKDITELHSCVVNGEFLAAPVAHTFQVISKVLLDEKASSLTQAKGLLEYMLWGPVDIRVSDNKDDVDTILQRWLDLQRAQMVKSLISNLHVKISSHTGFHVYEEYQLIFLLQATVKSLKDIIMKL